MHCFQDVVKFSCLLYMIVASTFSYELLTSKTFCNNPISALPLRIYSTRPMHSLSAPALPDCIFMSKALDRRTYKYSVTGIVEVLRYRRYAAEMWATIKRIWVPCILSTNASWSLYSPSSVTCPAACPRISATC